MIISELQSRTQWTVDKFAVFKKLLSVKHPKQIINWNPQRKQNRKPIELKYFMKNGIEHCNCTKCGKIKPRNNFCKCPTNGCKECRNKEDDKYHSTPIGHLRQILNSMKMTSKARNLNLPNVSLQDLKNMFDDQDGLCYYTGIQMNFGSYLRNNWTISPERMDITKGYTKENMRLICYEFNTADRTSTVKNSTNINGNGGWSLDKIKFLKEHINL